jgi:hypothetical protein
MVNAAHLLLGRATGRSHELGVRLALGASRARLARLFVAEALTHAVAASIVGLVVLMACQELIQSYEPRLFMPVEGAGLDGRTFIFLAAAAMVSVLVCALAPLLRSADHDIRRMIVRGADSRMAPGRARVMPAFVFVQAALAVLLVCGAGVMGRSAWNVLTVNTGVALDQLATVGLSSPASRYPTAEAQQQFFRQVGEALDSIPAVVGVTVSGMPLLNTSIQPGLAYLEGETRPEAARGEVTGLASVSPNYFDVLGMHITAGRGFTDDDDTTVAIVNESFAARRGGDVIGRLVYTPMGQIPFRIVGMVNDARSFGLVNETNPPSVFSPT